MTTEASPKVLIVSTKVDIATDHVVLKLRDLGASSYRINTEDFPLFASSSIALGSSHPSSWSWASGSKGADLDGVRSVWFRRHRLPVLPREVATQDAEYCLRESEWFLKGALYSKTSSDRPVKWMSHPAKIQMAESKIYQLSVAQSLGLAVPDTLISNDPQRVRGFFKEKRGEVVAKPLRLGYFDYGDRQTGVFTSQVAPDDLAEDAPLGMAPVIYQELLPKLFDIRVTVVGRRVFAAAIDSQSEPTAVLDWRRTDNEDLPHYAHDLPAQVRDACLNYMEMLGLNFGAIDFVLTPRNEYVFLEVNPNGQWVWIEEKLGFPITEAIATWLLDGLRD
jgi:glutathione synthase/RimK-type ligase-like ATP-grasp enzyme